MFAIFHSAGNIPVEKDLLNNTHNEVDNRPFPSSKKSHFQNEAKCEAIDMKMIFNYYANISHFHNKGFALSLVLKVRFFGTRKWPILVRILSKYGVRSNRARGTCEFMLDLSSCIQYM